MKSLLWITVLLWTLFCVLCAGVSIGQPIRLIAKVKGDVVSKGITMARLKEVSSGMVFSTLPLNKGNDVLSVVCLSSGVKESVINSLLSSGWFEYVEADPKGYGAGQWGEFPDDPGFDMQWYLNNDGSFPYAKAKAGADIQLLKAWEITEGDSVIVVAILDSGVNYLQPEFTGRLWVSDRASVGWDFIHEDADPLDDHGHGTAVAGIIAANADNAIGFAGIDQRCKLMICKVLDEHLSGFYSQWIAGIYYAVEHGAHVINLSLGGKEPSRALKEAVDYANSKGVLVVTSMQNYHTDTPYYPAAYSATVAVGATDPDDNRSTAFNNDSDYGSNYGDHIDLVAPGNFIFGLDRSGSGLPGIRWAGTSMATPVVTGIAALLLAQDQSRNAVELKNILYSTSEDLVGDLIEDLPGWDRYYGFGRVNAWRALHREQINVPHENVLSLYPNPAAGELNAEALLPIASNSDYVIIDSYGRTILRVSNPSVNRVIRHKIDISSLSPGLYVLQLRTDDTILMKRFLVVGM